MPKREISKKKTSRGRQKGKIFAGICLVAFAFIGYSTWQYQIQLPPTIGGGVNNPLPISAAPNFSLRDINGTQLSLNQFEGNIIAIHFMAVGCSGQYNAINDNQLKQLKTVCSTHCGKSPVTAVTVVVSTCSNNDLSLIRTKYGITWALGNDYADGKLDVIKAYESYSIEDGTIILVDRALNVDEVYTEAITSGTLSSRIGQLLGV